MEALERALDRADVWQPSTRAFSQLHQEGALEEARARQEAENPSGPLHGVPVAVKDLFDVAGWETSGCCHGYRGSLASADAEVVRRLRAAGAVIVGKTNQHELAAGGTNAVSACGPTRSPWDPTRLTGGSSGGSGAAVAARIVPIALGTDTGGSIRIPASMCGVVGLKPTTGRVPTAGMMPLARTLDTAGPLSTTVEDAALAFAVIAGEGERFLERSAGPVDGLRVAGPEGFFTARCRPDVLAAVGRAVDVLVEAGARRVGVRVGDVSPGNQAWVDIAWSELAAEHGHLLRRPDSVYPRTRAALEHGLSRTAVDLVRAQAVAADVRAMLGSALEEADALVLPATPFPAPHADEDTVDVGGGEPHLVHAGGPAWFTRVVNLAGLPALSLPAGFSREGMPYGIQVVGRAGEEEALLRLGTAFQDATDHHERVPDPPG